MQRCCPPAQVAREAFEAEAALFKAIADPYRLRMLATLARSAEEVCVCDFTDAFPLNQPTVSHHLRILRDAGLVYENDDPALCGSLFLSAGRRLVFHCCGM